MPGARLHAAAATMGLSIFLALLLGGTFAGRGSLFGEETSVGIEHRHPLTLRWDMSSEAGEGILDISHDGKETIFLSLPETWRKQEVRGALPEKILSDPPALGFVRWQLPPLTTVSFRIPKIPKNVIVENPTGVPLQINLKRIEVSKGEVTRDVVLVKDRAVALW